MDHVPIAAPQTHQRIIALVERRPKSAARLAETLLRTTSEAPPPLRGWSTYVYGWAALHAEQITDAIPYLLTAQILFEQEGMSHAARDSQCAMLIAQWLQGTGRQLQDAWAALLPAYDSADRIAAARAQMYRLAHLNFINHYGDVVQLAPPLLHDFAAPEARGLRGRLQRILAIAYANLGQLERADELLIQAEADSTAARYTVDVAKCWMERSYVAQRREHYETALAYLKPAYHAFRHQGLRLFSALCQRSLGLVYSRLGSFDQALQQTLAARSDFRDLQRRDLAAGCDLNLGVISHYAGLKALARTAYRRAEQVFIVNDQRRELFILQRNQALLQTRSGECEPALMLLNRLGPTATQLQDPLELAEYHATCAEAWRGIGNTTQAQEDLQRAIELFTAGKNHANVAECQLEHAWLLLEAGKIDVARTLLEQAKPFLQDRPMHEWRRCYAVGRCAEYDGDEQAALLAYYSASRLIVTMRQALVSEHASSAVFEQARHLYRDAIQLAVKHGDPEWVFRLIEGQRALTLMHQLRHPPLQIPPAFDAAHQHYNARLHRMATDVVIREADIDSVVHSYVDFLLQANHTVTNPITLPSSEATLHDVRIQFSAAFGTDWTLLAYAQDDTTLHTLLISATTAELSSQPYDAHLAALVDAASHDDERAIVYDNWGTLTGHQDWEHLDSLSTRLLPPAIQQRLHPQHRLLIVPCGPLHQLAWAALRSDGQRLCQRAIIQLIPSFAVWQHLQATTPHGNAALLIGCEDFGASAPQLLHAIEEVREIAAQLRESTSALAPCTVVDTLIGHEARRDTILTRNAHEGLQQYRLLHIVSHAQVLGRRGLLAHIKLGNEQLFYDDILRLRLGGATVALATCYGAALESLPGEEILSLSRAFFAAGARDVIANVWPTSDQEASGFFRELYHHWLGGKDTATALALAQRAAITGGDQTAASVVLWGGFQVQGAGTIT